MDERELDLEHELPAGDGDDAGGGATTTAQAPGELTETQKLKAERDALVDRLARLQAEFDNARKRAAREQQDYRDYALADAIKTLLPVMDSFQRALAMQGREGTEFRSGVELIYKQLEDALAKLGLQAISTKGQAFDPRLHEAIQMVDTTEAPDHQVLEEFQSGYKLKDRLIRPAMVKVARNPKHS
jgi:molecular chaperone GrpE